MFKLIKTAQGMAVSVRTGPFEDGLDGSDLDVKVRNLDRIQNLALAPKQEEKATETTRVQPFTKAVSTIGSHSYLIVQLNSLTVIEYAGILLFHGPENTHD